VEQTTAREAAQLDHHAATNNCNSSEVSKLPVRRALVPKDIKAVAHLQGGIEEQFGGTTPNCS
jgi:hypothetical protein